jgi:hypothetical protein
VYVTEDVGYIHASIVVDCEYQFVRFESPTAYVNLSPLPSKYAEPKLVNVVLLVCVGNGFGEVIVTSPFLVIVVLLVEPSINLFDLQVSN